MLPTKLDASQYLNTGDAQYNNYPIYYLAARFIAGGSSRLYPIFFTSFVNTIETQDGEEADGRATGGGGDVVGDWPGQGDDP